MKNLKNIAKGFLALSFLVGVAIAAPVQADNNVNSLLNARASLKADALIRMENSVGVVLGGNNTLRVLGAEVASVSGSDISAKAMVGNSALNFVVKTDANTKFNVKSATNTSFISQLEAGDKISFAGTITSSTSSSIVVDGDNVVSHEAFTKVVAETDDDDNEDDDKDDKEKNNEGNKGGNGLWQRIVNFFRK